MVLQLANNGDLREYLKINFSKLEWTDKLRMACEISDGLEFLHKNNIIHRDLTTYHKKSDIYSSGVILWEISSGRPPFQSFAKIPYGIIIHVFKGGREKPVEGTPDSYIQLKICWNYDPNQRPELGRNSRKLIESIKKRKFGTNKFDKFISITTPKISNSEIPLSTNSNNDYKKILKQSQQSLKFIDDLFMEYFLNACGNYNIDHVM
ncbi:kinase-like domain-containing protein [Gigaspora rosea]|uniref:Kinase-like domain-containing protein n=1 Tax=Gigaspora rosea TaxID=44941 RepID=A0A397UFW3_9GLOM|nr:kinase-like domain-containing protein [Gigaspora rosea]